MSSATSAVSEERTAVVLAGAPGTDTPARPQRRRERFDITLTELDPRDVADGVLLDNGLFLAPDPMPVGTMRETCPHCRGVALQLVLRRHHVKRSHLFCAQCTRCYDAVSSGYSILGIV